MLSIRPLPLALHTLTLAAALALPALASAATLYSQPYNPATPNGGWWASTVEQRVHFDSFVLAADARIESIAWNGMGIEEAFGLPTAHPASFTIGIYADGPLFAPGALLASSTIGNSGNPVNTGIKFADVISIFSYSGTLATSFQASAGVTYWIGIVDATSYASWYWASGMGGDGLHTGLISGQITPGLDEDLAFSLNGTVGAVPEPASAALFALGAAGLLGAIARRRRD